MEVKIPINNNILKNRERQSREDEQYLEEYI